MTPFASPGEIVTCEDGHPICEVAEPLMKNMKLSVLSFRDWKIDKPKPGDRLNSTCPQCGERWIKDGETGPWALHVNGEWRTP